MSAFIDIAPSDPESVHNAALLEDESAEAEAAREASLPDYTPFSPTITPEALKAVSLAEAAELWDGNPQTRESYKSDVWPRRTHLSSSDLWKAVYRLAAEVLRPHGTSCPHCAQQFVNDQAPYPAKWHTVWWERFKEDLVWEHFTECLDQFDGDEPVCAKCLDTGIVLPVSWLVSIWKDQAPDLKERRQSMVNIDDMQTGYEPERLPVWAWLPEEKDWSWRPKTEHSPWVINGTSGTPMALPLNYENLEEFGDTYIEMTQEALAQETLKMLQNEHAPVLNEHQLPKWQRRLLPNENDDSSGFEPLSFTTNQELARREPKF